MVMEATSSPPSPQCVGREFVRQYYTLLNKAPAHLHRFYNNQSSFVHGGLDPPNRETSPMIGQKQIHQKIQQLNFQDCHAKITQVDSQATLGNGVVVQVTGELSNAGQPMRRFTQTFVLAAQTPKKYYVHNDIFRYQDEIFTDEECDQESGRSDADDEMVQDQTTVPDVPQPMSQQQLYYAAAATAPTSALQAPQGALPPMAPTHQITPQVIAPAAVPTPNVATVNGAVHPEDVIMQQASSVTASVPPGIAQMPPVPASLQGLSMVPPSAPVIPSVNAMQIEETITQPTNNATISETTTEELATECVIENEKKEYIQEAEMNEEVSLAVEPTPPSNEPKTYATSLKSGGGPISFASAAMSTTLNQTPKLNAVSPPPIPSRNEPRDSHPVNANSNQGPRGPMRQNRGPPGSNRGPPRQEGRGNPPPRNSFTDDNDDRRRSSGPGPQYGDSHQLFLGNLPLQATEEELRQLFSIFGPIADLRVHSKPSSKGGMPGARVPNYGFITFEDIQSVQKCLQGRPLYFPPNSENGQKLNVEEKKTRPRGMDSSGGGSGGRVSNSGPGNNQPESGNSGNNVGRSNMNSGGPGAGNGVRGAGGNNAGMMRAGGVGGPPRGNRSGFNRSEGGGGGGGRSGGGSGGGAIRNSNNFNRR